MMVTSRPVGLGRAVVGRVGLVRGDEKRREKRRYSDAAAMKLGGLAGWGGGVARVGTVVVWVVVEV